MVEQEDRKELNGFVVLIPAFNEEKTIADVVRRALPFVRKVLVVDDGSTDRTGELARSAGAEVLRHPVNQGKGVSLQEGFRRSLETGAEGVIVLDGDGQHEPDEIPRFLSAARESGAAIVVGNRMETTAGMPPIRYNTNRLTSLIVSFLAGRKIPDSQCGFRLLKRKVLEEVVCTTRNYDMESEQLIKAGRMGFRISSLPIRCIYSGQESQIKPGRDTWRFICLVLRSLFARRVKKNAE
jgi:glycosyltransferase involved in cell wall biosynthesis